jgi:DNA-binding response OmpR family regulator
VDPVALTQQRLLVVDDDATIAGAVATRLRAEGFAVEIAHDGPSAVAACAALQPHAVVLDVMLPGFDGYEVCRRIQAERPVPVLMLTARGDENDLLVGLGVGADDYLTKPFSLRELVARLRALLRRTDRPPLDVRADPTTVRVGELEIDRGSRMVRRHGAPVHLTRTEFDLIAYLAARPKQVFTRDQLLDAVWEWPDAAGNRTVDSHVKTLRRKLGAEAVRTVHGVGYALGIYP